MLQNIKNIYGAKLTASDGEIGHVKDFYFDDKTWVIRYLVADTGSWMAGRLVLLTPHIFGKWDLYGMTLHVSLRKEQIENSPSIEAHKPVSRQYEIDYYRYYGWPNYWDGGAMWGSGEYPSLVAPSIDEFLSTQRHHHRDDRHLQSTQAVTGYQIQAIDGEIGTVSGFVVDDKSWAIRELAVETGHWYSGNQILIAPDEIERVSYEDSSVFVKLTKADIQRTAENHLVRAGSLIPRAVEFPTD
jgi:uncharacterized protein YrrD